MLVYIFWISVSLPLSYQSSLWTRMMSSRWAGTLCCRLQHIFHSPFSWIIDNHHLLSSRCRRCTHHNLPILTTFSVSSHKLKVEPGSFCDKAKIFCQDFIGDMMVVTDVSERAVKDRLDCEIQPIEIPSLLSGGSEEDWFAKFIYNHLFKVVLSKILHYLVNSNQL